MVENSLKCSLQEHCIVDIMAVLLKQIDCKDKLWVQIHAYASSISKIHLKVMNPSPFPSSKCTLLQFSHQKFQCIPCLHNYEGGEVNKSFIL
jgi:hypothetical protein